MGKELDTNEDYLKDCFMQQCQDEIDAFYKDEESVLDKYSRLAIKNLPFLSLGASSTLLLLYSPLHFKFTSQLIGLFFLIFTLSVILVTRYYFKNRENTRLRLEIYDAWQKTIFAAIVINFGLYIVSDSPSTHLLVIISFAAMALIYIQNGVKRSLLSF